MDPKFTPSHGHTPAVLLCPACGFNYLHHHRVEVFDRKEDEEKGVHVSVTHGKAVFDQDLSGNPSSRRDGVCIYFTCEGCPAETVLTIAQHKGETHVEISHRTPDVSLN